MANGGNNNNSYGEECKKHQKENKRRFKELGVAKKGQSLKEKNEPKVKSKKPSSPPHNAATSYADEFVDDRPQRKKAKSSSRPRQRPEKVATEEERADALKRAMSLQGRLESAGHPLYIKSMLKSHVYKGFWLNVPTEFCDKCLNKERLPMWLEDEEGKEYETKFIGDRTGSSAGWRKFAMDHELDDGDALIFQLIDTNKTRFKICSKNDIDICACLHIFKGSDDEDEGNVKNMKKVSKRKYVPEEVIKSDEKDVEQSAKKDEDCHNDVVTNINRSKKATDVDEETNESTF
ncbi:hypothetical protein MKX01_026507 [Papaver californicum]|nr:hypothetical protein MKX01_026507 [Papaver californicum]